MVTASHQVSLELPNGSFNYHVSPIAGWHLSSTPYRGVLHVAGANVKIIEQLLLVKYKVVFTESGLAAGARWNATIGSTTISSKTAGITFELANGSFTFFTAAVGYTAASATGSFAIAGAGTKTAIVFT